MQRDVDLIRSLMLEIEGGRADFVCLSSEECEILGIEDTGLSQDRARQLSHHIQLLSERNLVMFVRTGTHWHVERILWDGHDFLDSVRNEEVWNKTRAGVRKAGVFTFDFLVDVAKGFAKTQLEKHTGIELSK
ncbi:Hypothetical protein SAMN05428964_11139 [Thalassospira xiamenensis]|uniref:DUF2513 domain-containing protein n=1 Tax=Thalassospira xiamenensis TaxID=220697 RepID=A0A285TZI0_9PROT|nr:Hypothetical protein SAMN05428964_1092 [Thalassospira xiamenensis]SOC30971.1 Hypothetical protein SAMN05428964_11139 [Thalassospira xiamenensis]